MGYTTEAAVAPRLRRLLPNGLSDSPGTTPTLADVNTMIADISAEIDMYLATVGYVVPVTAPADFLAWLGHVCEYGVTSEALKVATPDQPNIVNGAPVAPAYAFWETRYQNALKAIISRQVVSDGAAASGDTDAKSYLTGNPDNGGNDGNDGFQAADWGKKDQPYFSMQRVF